MNETRRRSIRPVIQTLELNNINQFKVQPKKKKTL